MSWLGVGIACSNSQVPAVTETCLFCLVLVLIICNDLSWISNKFAKKFIPYNAFSSGSNLKSWQYNLFNLNIPTKVWNSKPDRSACLFCLCLCVYLLIFKAPYFSFKGSFYEWNCLKWRINPHQTYFYNLLKLPWSGSCSGNCSISWYAWLSVNPSTRTQCDYPEISQLNTPPAYYVYVGAAWRTNPVSYTHLTLPTKLEV